MSTADIGEAPHELRLALVLNGGVSLAVWIGGVTAELSRVALKIDRYGKLAALLGLEPRIDVISGASAGGINGGLLALGLTRGQEITHLRDLWLRKASLHDLLRDASTRDPASLLKGDYFYDQLKVAYEKASLGSIQPASKVPIDLTLTTTLLDGKNSELVDDFGAPVNDRDHRAAFRFTRSRENDSFRHAEIVQQLALASRATASFPGAFEPVFCRVSGNTSNDRSSTHMRGILEGIEEDSYLVDGGVLDNKPLEPALRGIFRQPANGPVRRVLMYVVPVPEDASPRNNADATKPPDLLNVIQASLIGLPRVESIACELRELQERNEATFRSRRSRMTLTCQTNPEDIDALAKLVYPVYRVERREAATQYLVGQIVKALARHVDRGFSHIGRRRWLENLLRSDSAWVPDESFERALNHDIKADAWRWGIRPIEYAFRLMWGLLGAAQRFSESTRDCPWKLQTLLDRAYEILPAVEKLSERQFWNDQISHLVRDLERGSSQPETAIIAWVPAALTAWSAEMRRPLRPMMEAIAHLVNDIAVEILRANPHWNEPRDDPRGRGDSSANEAEEKVTAREIICHAKYFVRPNETPSIERLIQRLLHLEIITRSGGSQGDYREQIVSFIQISGCSAGPFNSPSSGSGRLAGAQLANFGGFYKRAWRAHDWMHGRLDGCTKAVETLLDPVRLKIKLGDRSSETILDTLVALATEGLSSSEGLLKDWKREFAAKELEYLTHEDIPVPARLPFTAEILIRRLHYDIILEELPIIQAAMLYDAARGASLSPDAKAFLVLYGNKVASSPFSALPVSEVLDLYRACQITGEAVHKETGTDHFLVTATQALAVTTGAIQANVRLKVFNVLWWASRIAHWLALGLVHRSRFAAAALTGGFCAGAGILVSHCAFEAKTPGWLLGAAWIAVLAVFLVFVLRLPLRRR